MRYCGYVATMGCNRGWIRGNGIRCGVAFGAEGCAGAWHRTIFARARSGKFARWITNYSLRIFRTSRLCAAASKVGCVVEGNRNAKRDETCSSFWRPVWRGAFERSDRWRETLFAVAWNCN